MNVTVIIPTYNRADILAKTLEAYAAQLGEHRICEILVVDDGSTDHTRSAVEKASESCRRIRYLRQSNLGLAAARNHGIREAAGDVLLFGDDDIIPSPRLAAEHVAWQDRYPEGNCGVLGHVAWWPDVRPTPFMKWEGLYGPQFNYGCFEHGQELSYEFGNTGRNSVMNSGIAVIGAYMHHFYARAESSVRDFGPMDMRILSWLTDYRKRDIDIFTIGTLLDITISLKRARMLCGG
jgi:glycosyltransferase involved in cell wall biosynthesis